MPYKSTVYRVVTRFRGTGSVDVGKLSGRLTVLNDASVEKIIQLLVQISRKSLICNLIVE